MRVGECLPHTYYAPGVPPKDNLKNVHSLRRYLQPSQVRWAGLAPSLCRTIRIQLDALSLVVYVNYFSPLEIKLWPLVAKSPPPALDDIVDATAASSG